MLEQKLGALFCLIGGSNRHPTDDFGLALIWNEIICGGDFLEVNWLSRSGIHDAANTVCFRKPHGVVNGTQGNLELHDDGVRLAQKRRSGIHVLRGKCVICAFDDDDAILPARIHEDGSDATRNAFGDTYVGCVNPLRFEVLDRGRSKEIASDFCHHAHACSAQTRCHRLIGAFSPEAKVELLAEDGLARPREHVIERGEVHVGASYYYDHGFLGRHSASGYSARGLYKNPSGEPQNS